MLVPWLRYSLDQSSFPSRPLPGNPEGRAAGRELDVFPGCWAVTSRARLPEGGTEDRTGNVFFMIAEHSTKAFPF